MMTALVLQPLEVPEATHHRWLQKYDGMKSGEVRRRDSSAVNCPIHSVVDNPIVGHRPGAQGQEACQKSAEASNSGT